MGIYSPSKRALGGWGWVAAGFAGFVVSITASVITSLCVYNIEARSTSLEQAYAYDNKHQ